MNQNWSYFSNNIISDKFKVVVSLPNKSIGIIIDEGYGYGESDNDLMQVFKVFRLDDYRIINCLLSEMEAIEDNTIISNALEDYKQYRLKMVTRPTTNTDVHNNINTNTSIF